MNFLHINIFALLALISCASYSTEKEIKFSGKIIKVNQPAHTESYIGDLDNGEQLMADHHIRNNEFICTFGPIGLPLDSARARKYFLAIQAAYKKQQQSN